MRKQPNIIAALTLAYGAALQREFAKMFAPPAKLAPPTDRAPSNRGTDPTSQRVYALIFNGVTRGTVGAGQFMLLSDRERVASAVYEELASGGVSFRVEDGLDRLRRVAAELNDQD